MHQHPPTCAALGYFGVAWRKHVAFGKAQLLCRCVHECPTHLPCLGLADGGVLRVRHHLLEIRSYPMVYLLMCLAGNELRQQGQCDFLTEGDGLCSGIGCCRDSAIDAVILPRSEATEAHESAISQLQPACF